jgi:hypothetical protein
MNRRGLVVLAILFAGLVALVMLQGRDQPAPPIAVDEISPEVPQTPAVDATATPQPTEPAANFTRLYPEMAVLDIQAIRLEDPNSGEKFTISRGEDGQWTAPENEGTLDTEAASNIARTVALLLYERIIEADEQTELNQYGFSPNGRLFIQVVMRNGETHAIGVGAFTPSGGAYYAVISENDDIYLLERGQMDFLMNYLSNPPLT